MAADLLERDAALAILDEALTGAEAGAGSVVLLFGEAGIGKTSVVRAFCRAVGRRARVLAGACDDLLSPRTLGPLHDMVRAAPDGRLAAALRGDRDDVLVAVQEELSDPRRPTLLVVEDAHWADEATLDVLRYVGRRIADHPAVLLITYRDDEVGPELLRRVLGGLGGPSVRRIGLAPLSRAAVTGWAGGTAITTAELYRQTRGNPFFVSEVLAGADRGVPPTVVDAVLARVRRLDEATQRHLEQLAVVPSQVELPLARALLGRITVLDQAERRGVVEVRPYSVGFRHELARRAVEGAVPAAERMHLNERVLAALLDQPEPDLARVVHHAVQAGDDETVVTHAPRAARTAVAAGAPRQAAELYEQALRRAPLLGTEEHAAVAEAYAWTMYHCDRPHEGVAAGADAVRLREAGGDVEALAQALASLSVLQWAAMRIDEALASGERAVALLEPRGDSAAAVYCLTFLGTLLVNIDREPDALATLDAALAMAGRTGRREFEPVIWTFRGRSRLQLGDDGGLADCDHGGTAGQDGSVARRPARVLATLLTVCAMAAAPSCARGTTPAAPDTPPATALPPSTSGDVTAETSAGPAGRPAHVVIVMLENKDQGDVLRDGPYLASLAASGASLTDMHAETHPSQPNYLALFSGGTQGVEDDRCPLRFDGPDLASELTAAGYGFVGYAEDLPQPGFTGCSAGDYARKHSPWTDFADVPAEANQPLSAMPTDYAQLPTVAFVIPNLCHDMHNCSIAEGDEWLRENIDAYARWALTHDSLLIVSFDESVQGRPTRIAGGSRLSGSAGRGARRGTVRPKGGAARSGWQQALVTR
jgi:tetratricopeptide (TPR) repeat protein